jgi:hypothetical protein
MSSQPELDKKTSPVADAYMRSLLPSHESPQQRGMIEFIPPKKTNVKPQFKQPVKVGAHANTEPKFSIRAKYNDLTPAQEATMIRISAITFPEPISQRIAGWKSNLDIETAVLVWVSWAHILQLVYIK